MIVKAPILHLSPDHGVGHIHSTFHHDTELGNSDGENKIGLKMQHALNQELVYLDHIGLVPGSTDGMVKVLQAKHHFEATGDYNGLKGTPAFKQCLVDEMKMFKGVKDAQAHNIVDRLGIEQ